MKRLKKMTRLVIIFLIAAMCTWLCMEPSGEAKHLHPERWYQERWCKAHNGIMEYRLSDGTRVDCLTDEYAVEVEFAEKWAEAIGQALYYAAMTGRKPAILLIMERGERDRRYLERIRVAAPWVVFVV